MAKQDDQPRVKKFPQLSVISPRELLDADGGIWEIIDYPNARCKRRFRNETRAKFEDERGFYVRFTPTRKDYIVLTDRTSPQHYWGESASLGGTRRSGGKKRRGAAPQKKSTSAAAPSVIERKVKILVKGFKTFEFKGNSFALTGDVRVFFKHLHGKEVIVTLKVEGGVGLLIYSEKEYIFYPE